jgi:hypothetical protein
MKITNIEKIKGWTTPGNPSTKPVVTDVEIGILDYTFDIRYYGIRYTMTILRDEFDSIGGFGRHKIGFQTSGHQFETLIYQRTMRDMREFYDVFHTMLHRINQGTFNRHYPKN